MSEVAVADDGTVHLVDGGRIQGDVTYHRPGDRTVVLMGDGERVELRGDEVREVVYDAPQTQAPVEAPTLPPAVEPVTDRRALEAELVTLQKGRPSVGGPVVLSIVGVVGLLTGVAVRLGGGDRGLSRGLLITGGITTLLGVVVFAPLRGARIKRWDRRIQELELRLAPAVTLDQATLTLLATF